MIWINWEVCIILLMMLLCTRNFCNYWCISFSCWCRLCVGVCLRFVCKQGRGSELLTCWRGFWFSCVSLCTCRLTNWTGNRWNHSQSRDRWAQINIKWTDPYFRGTCYYFYHPGLADRLCLCLFFLRGDLKVFCSVRFGVRRVAAVVVVGAGVVRSLGWWY